MVAIQHPWHGVHPGPETPSVVLSVIEIPKGSKNKYEIHKDSGLLLLDRVCSSSTVYPANYGFIPQTYCDDNDALDIFVLGQDVVPPLTLVRARVIGCLKMIDGGEMDDKILAVHADDKQYAAIKELVDLEKSNPHVLKEIEQFFKTYKLLDNKKVETQGWVGRAEAEVVVRESLALYEANKEKLLK